MLWRTLHVSHFEIHLEHQVIPMTRVRDCVLMEFFVERRYDIDTLKYLSRVRVFLNAMFLLDGVTADGKRLEQHVYL